MIKNAIYDTQSLSELTLGERWVGYTLDWSPANGRAWEDEQPLTPGHISIQFRRGGGSVGAISLLGFPFEGSYKCIYLSQLYLPHQIITFHNIPV